MINIYELTNETFAEIFNDDFIPELIALVNAISNSILLNHEDAEVYTASPYQNSKRVLDWMDNHPEIETIGIHPNSALQLTHGMWADLCGTMCAIENREI